MPDEIAGHRLTPELAAKAEDELDEDDEMEIALLPDADADDEGTPPARPGPREPEA